MAIERKFEREIDFEVAKTPKMQTVLSVENGRGTGLKYSFQRIKHIFSLLFFNFSTHLSCRYSKMPAKNLFQWYDLGKAEPAVPDLRICQPGKEI